MLQSNSKIQIIDNTVCVVAKVLSASKRPFYYVGDTIKVSIRQVRSSKVRSKRLRAFTKGQLCKVLLLSSKRYYRRQNILFLSSLNTGCIVAPDGSPLASRIRGVVFKELPYQTVRLRRLLSISEFLV